MATIYTDPHDQQLTAHELKTVAIADSLADLDNPIVNKLRHCLAVKTGEVMVNAFSIQLVAALFAVEGNAAEPAGLAEVVETAVNR